MGSGKVTVWYFYGNGCEHCETVTPYVQSLQKKYPDVEFHILEIYDNPANRDTLIAMNQKHGQKNSGIPVAYVGDVMLFGGNEVPEKLEKCNPRAKTLTGPVDLANSDLFPAPAAGAPRW